MLTKLDEWRAENNQHHDQAADESLVKGVMKYQKEGQLAGILATTKHTYKKFTEQDERGASEAKTSSVQEANVEQERGELLWPYLAIGLVASEKPWRRIMVACPQ